MINKTEKIEELLKNIYQELANPLNKKDVLSKITTNEFDYDGFHILIQQYLEHIRALRNAPESVQNEIFQHVEFIHEILHNETVRQNIRRFISSAIVLQKYIPEEFAVKYSDHSTQINQDEFSERYDRLVKMLNPLSEKSNLTLYTKKEKTPFSLYRNNNDSIAVMAGQGKSPLSFTRDKLISIIYDGLKVDYHTSYSDVIVEKIMDNSIFELMRHQNDDTLRLNFDSMPEARIEKLEYSKAAILEQLANLENIVEARNDQYEQLHDFLVYGKEIQAEYANTKKAFEEDMKLKSAVTYWSNKAEKHFKLARAFAIIAFIFSILILIAIYQFLDGNFTDIIDNNTSVTLVSESTKNITWHKVWHYGYLLFATSVGIWIIRLIVKLFLSNYHLSVDAEERAVMMETYLALTKEGQGLSDNDKQLVLQSLFRPINFGIIKDESNFSLIDLLNSFKTKKD